MKLKFTLLSIMLFCVAQLSAQHYKEDYIIKKGSAPAGQSIDMIYGVMAGITAPRLSDKNDLVDFDGTVGYNIGMMWGVDLGGLEIVPEIWYQHNKTNFINNDSKKEGDIVSNAIEMPIIIGIELGPVRFNFGPSLSLMSNDKISIEGEEKMDFGGYKSTAGYLFGLSSTLWDHFVVDMRYTGRFVKTSSAWNNEVDIFKDAKYRYYSFGFNVGYRF